MNLDSAQLLRLSELTEQTLDQAPASRDAWLQVRPAADALLAGRLRRALARLESGMLLDVLPKLVESAWLGRTGERVGPYELVEPLGRGGMGEVWRAQRADGAFEREVALKIPRQRLGHDLAARLQFECQVAARLEHRHIARLYDAGLDPDGRPWIASELVRGLPLDTAASGKPLAVRLRWLAWVARAVAHAHGRGVLHRDLKPANVLVDADGVPHLLDFGVAALAGMPDAGPRALTPRYAAPEQRAGAPEDVRSDVHALGVMAAELCEAPDADLAAVIASARAANPEQRYASAADLADELERCARGDPVRARPLGWWQRRWRGWRRHRLQATLAATALLALFGTAAFGLLQMQRSAQAEARQRQAEAFVADLLRIGQQSAGRGEVLLDRGPELVAERFAGQHELQWELLGTLDRAMRDVGDNAQLLQLRERRVALMDSLRLDADARVEARLALVESQLMRGLLAEAGAQLDLLGTLDTGQAQRASLLRARLLMLRGETDTPQRLLAELDRQWPPDGPLRISWWHLHAEMRYRAGQLQAAIAAYETAAGLAEAMSDFVLAADARSRAASWAAEQGQPDRALALHASAQSLLRSQGGLHLVRAAFDQAHFWGQMPADTADAAARQTERVQDAWRQIEWLGDAAPPRVAAQVRRSLASVLLRHGQVDAGRAHMVAALAVLLQGEQRPLHRAYLHSSTAELLSAEGRLAEAESAMLAGLAERQQAGFGTHPYVVNVYLGLALNALAMGQPDRALAHLDSAPADAALRAAGHDPAWYRQVLDKTRARVLLDAGRPADALQAVQQVPPQATDFQPDVMAIGLPWLRASSLCRLGRRAEGRAELADAVGRMPAGGPRDHPEVQRARRDCGLPATGRAEPDRCRGGRDMEASNGRCMPQQSLQARSAGG